MLEELIENELRQVSDILTEMIGLVSRWSGNVALVQHSGFHGKKPFACDILLDLTIAEQDVRWRTMIHELLHAMSVGCNASSFQQNRGWEEGVVEQLQRILRPAILAKVGVGVPEEVFAQVEREHVFNVYIDALEAVRLEIGRDATAFCVGLLKTSLGDRHSSLVGIHAELSPSRRRKYLEVLSASNQILRGKIV